MRRAAALLAVLVVAGCGSASRLSRQDLVAKGNAICAKFNEKQKRIPQPTSLTEIAPALHQLLPLAKEQVAELGKLRPPQDLEQTWNDLLDKARNENEFAEQRLIPAADRKDTAAIRRLGDELIKLDARSNAVARRLSLSQCAREG